MENKQHCVYYIFCKTPEPVFVAWTSSERIADDYVSGYHRLVDAYDLEYDDYFYIAEEVYPYFTDDIYDHLRVIGETECVSWIPRAEENILQYELSVVSSNDEIYITTVDFLDTIESALLGGDVETYMKQYMMKITRLFMIVEKFVKGKEFADASHYLRVPMKLAIECLKYFQAPMEEEDDVMATLLSEHICGIELYRELHYNKE